MAQRTIAVPALEINNEVVAIVPNSLVFTEGFGEQTVLTQSAGGGIIETVYSDNAELKISMVKFELHTTQQNIDLVRSWKVNLNNNAISITDSGLERTFTNMALTSNYEVQTGSEGKIAIEFKGDPSV